MMRTQANMRPSMGAVLYEDDDGDYATLAISGDSARAAKANAQTWAAAHNVANKLDAMGVDGLKAIEGLVDFVSDINKLRDPYDVADRLHTYMQSIQRKDNE